MKECAYLLGDTIEAQVPLNGHLSRPFIRKDLIGAPLFLHLISCPHDRRYYIIVNHGNWTRNNIGDVWQGETTT